MSGDVLAFPLTHGGVAYVDAIDAELIASRKWRVDSRGYVVGSFDNRRRLLHRLLLNAPAGIEVDHIDRDKLNNRRSNLRLCTRHENARNVGNTRGRSRFKGVSWHARSERWRAHICADCVVRFLGSYRDETDAARAYDLAAVRLHGAFAVLNLPERIHEPPPVRTTRWGVRK